MDKDVLDRRLHQQSIVTMLFESPGNALPPTGIASFQAPLEVFLALSPLLLSAALPFLGPLLGRISALVAKLEGQTGAVFHSIEVWSRPESKLKVAALVLAEAWKIAIVRTYWRYWLGVGEEGIRLWSHKGRDGVNEKEAK